WSLGLPVDMTVLLGGEDFLKWGIAGVILGNVINVMVFLVKGWLLVFVMMWVRWTLPRLRIDQVMMLCLKYLIPISCVLLAGVSAWTLFIPINIQQYIGCAIFVLCLIATLSLVFKMVTLAKMPPGTGMPGMWRTKGLPGYQGATRPN